MVAPHLGCDDTRHIRPTNGGLDSTYRFQAGEQPGIAARPAWQSRHQGRLGLWQHAIQQHHLLHLLNTTRETFQPAPRRILPSDRSVQSNCKQHRNLAVNFSVGAAPPSPSAKSMSGWIVRSSSSSLRCIFFHYAFSMPRCPRRRFAPGECHRLRLDNSQVSKTPRSRQGDIILLRATSAAFTSAARLADPVSAHRCL